MYLKLLLMTLICLYYHRCPDISLQALVLLDNKMGAVMVLKVY